MKKLISIDKFCEGSHIQGFYICVKKNIRHTKGGDLYIDLQLRDMTGNIGAKIWENISDLGSKFEKGDAVAISGYVESYLDHLQLIIKKINKATLQYYGRYGFDPASIVPSSKQDPQKMWKVLLSIIKDIKTKELKRLLFLIYRSNKNKIMIQPGSIKSSYNFRSGFLEQTISMAQIAKKLSPFYNIDKDLVIGGVLLIKIGVIKHIKPGYITDYSKEGNLLGQSVISRDILRSATKRVKNFPFDLKIKLEHILLSFENNFQPKTTHRPSFPEALLIHFIYKMDSNMNLMQKAILEDKGEDDFTSSYNHFRAPILKK